MRQPLDLYDRIPEAQRAYLSNYGWHFSKKACDFAVSMMKKEDVGGKSVKLEGWSKEQIDELLTKYGIKLQKNEAYDYVYVANMCKAVYLKKSVIDEQHAMMYVRDTVDNIDGNDGDIMRGWYAKMVGGGVPIEWEDMI